MWLLRSKTGVTRWRQDVDQQPGKWSFRHFARFHTFPRGAVQKVTLIVRVNDKRGRHLPCPELLASAAEHRPGEEITARSCEIFRCDIGVVV